MHALNRDDWWRFASAGTRTGKLAVTHADGSPHVTPVWFLLHANGSDDELVFTTGLDTVKGRALRRDPRLSLCVDDQQPPFSFVQFTAEANLFEDLEEMRYWSSRLGARYMGGDRAEEFGKRNAVPGEALVRARITKVIAFGGLTD
ncbi:PPOX class probable F420-dependent enzyme [Amycolatopsis endophytica]|uniref:PPOX class probable F420-dependent enzyme n=1 Tax=Amycolatopsis endophytica TaxID=860233 RepID=A0A853B8Q2_9PSEU|nr:PPOX class F420-dependent oxidoreductase [Amycolatopsis endophytica]NYI91144.1 PPOX class probable F420-dependent enzyme [Amycolatopsis endophytica]